jgi:hypothetical protein
VISTQDRPARKDVRRSTTRPEPCRAPELVHLTLGELRAYRQELTSEEIRVSYWRRILQARLDTVTDGREDHASLSRIREVLHEHVGSSHRLAMLPIASPDDAPPLPDLAALWESTGTDEAATAALVPRLVEAEGELSAYRRALHARLNAATSELIWRYREQPTLALTALPLPPSDR